MDWKQEVFKRLDALGEKLGVAAGHLWHVLVRQVVVEGVVHAVWTVVGAICFGLCVKIFFRTIKQQDGERDIPDSAVAKVVVSATFGVGGVITAIVNLDDAITYLLNPEYHALQKIAELFGK